MQKKKIVKKVKETKQPKEKKTTPEKPVRKTKKIKEEKIELEQPLIQEVEQHQEVAEVAEVAEIVDEVPEMPVVEEKIEVQQPEPEKFEEAVPEKVEPQVMTKKTRIHGPQIEIPTLSTTDGKINVECIGNCGSFVMGQKYRVSPRVFERFKSILRPVVQ